MNTTINRQELAKEIHANAVAKGFWDKEESIEHYFMLVVTELSEAVEAHRKERWANREAYQQRMSSNLDNLDKRQGFEMYIKDTVEDELGDAYIRLLDIMAGKGYQICDANIEISKNLRIEHPVTPAESFTEVIFNICKLVMHFNDALALSQIEYVAHTLHIDIFWHIREKMKYNASRPRLHGKKY